MSKLHVPIKLRIAVELLANGVCEYCKCLKKYVPAPFHVDHVDPESNGGKTELGNLASVCSGCNGGKHNKTHALDPFTQQLVPLFHPRRQKWSDHFTWSANKLYVVGKTSIGRATIICIKLNRPEVVNLRRLTLATGEHPPVED